MGPNELQTRVRLRPRPHRLAAEVVLPDETSWRRCLLPWQRAFMSSAPRQEFLPELGAPIAEKVSSLLQSVRRTSLQEAELLSVAKAWTDMESSSYLGQKKAAPTLALVFALRAAHDAISCTVSWPTPEED